MLADGEPNVMTLHAGTPVVQGTKYIITKWYRTRPWGVHG
jgi:prolyl 4-hydroxylase